jgi:crossover junction endodeoxyribonuclease RuvC
LIKDFAIEAPFFGKNVQSMLKLGRAQGVAIAAAISAGLQVTEYSPKKIKQSITGNGNADKEQVWKMLQRLLSLKEEPQYYDATDALAVAVCHHFQDNQILKTAGKLKSWKDFITSNPSRIKPK